MEEYFEVGCCCFDVLLSRSLIHMQILGHIFPSCKYFVAMLLHIQLLLQCYRVEADRQRAELQQQHETEQKAAVDQLTSLKVAEMAALKQGWQHKVNELLQQVEILPHYCCQLFSTVALCSLFWAFGTVLVSNRQGIYWI